MFLMFFCALVNAQNDDAVREFQIGLNLYDTQNYNDALQIFNQILANDELNSRTTVAYLFKGKTSSQIKPSGRSHSNSQSVH